MNGQAPGTGSSGGDHARQRMWWHQWVAWTSTRALHLEIARLTMRSFLRTRRFGNRWAKVHSPLWARIRCWTPQSAPSA